MRVGVVNDDGNESDEGRGNSITSSQPSNNCTQTPEKSKDIISFYSELHYIESKGILRQMRPPKHRGVSTTIVSTSNDDGDLNNETSSSSNISIMPTSSASITTNNPWDRPTKLKISYRIRLSDNHIQFALIIYDSITKNPNTNRNLSEEFKKMQSNKELTKSKKKLNLNTKKSNTVPSMKKSLRF